MTRPRFFFLVCPDPQLLKAQIDERLRTSGQDGWERKPFWADDEEPLPQTFWTDLTIKSLFPQPKALILRRAHTLKADYWDKLDASVKGLGSDIYPFFCLEGAWSGKKAPIPPALSRRGLFKKAKNEGWIWESPGLDQRSLTDFVKGWAAKTGLTFEPGAGQALTHALPTDAVAARLELDKIELAAGDAKVVRKEHVSLVARTGEMPFFDLMDALGQPGAEASVWKRVIDDHSKSAKDQMLFNLIGFLASQARMYWMLAHGEKPAGNPYMLQKKAPVAKRLGAAGVARMIDLAMEAELSLKTGERKYEEALDMLMAGLIDLFRPKQQLRRH
ncbi:MULTISPECIES: DNA polymerase III subunit delta [unclassified Pseudodesulfovibrio]|uniref:DNA polymerase III subunit delta n=1 Tax=unclassified Pseudodesulfovibrio TaxID=2661612 RepID=UPI000FEBE1A1|nr:MULTISPECIES: DNA polymerase III subunit delta [unclassified Pseudodesulfovibrio]MCJ2165962.1 DNA polymerase III subunit delta [Pseudodesulfovibrio sp. S3-i]RWU02635.1 DNA polymerase III subunit delta [Pseudodesulfovibrio sp. S3]